METIMNRTGDNGVYNAEVELILAHHKGDVRAALEALLKDRNFLIREVEYASLASVDSALNRKPLLFSRQR
jgi:hypothetical protein